MAYCRDIIMIFPGNDGISQPYEKYDARLHKSGNYSIYEFGNKLFKKIIVTL